MKLKAGLMLSSICLMAMQLTSPIAALAQDVSTFNVVESNEVASGNTSNITAAPIEASGVTEDTDFDTAMATLSQYLVYSSNGQRNFDLAKAEGDNASEYLLAAGAELNRFAASYEGNGDGIQLRSMPGYGNRCGPGNSGPGAPINTLDRLCQQHDRCYGNRGYFACSCDRELIAGIRANSFSGFAENAAALAVATYFNSALCNPFA